MQPRHLLSFLLCPVLAASTPATLPSIETDFPLVQRWAGSDAPSMGFTREQLVAFMAARVGDLTVGKQAPWSDWLKGLDRSHNPSLKAWALARRIEAGDYQAYPDFQQAVAEHVLGISKPWSGRTDKVLTDPPRTFTLPMPRTLAIDHDSVFWLSLRRTIQSTPRRQLEGGLYTVWCYGTHPDQRDLILELAAYVQTTVTTRNATPDPWNDPRFWIVVDWAMAWGLRDDFEAIRMALPRGAPSAAFDRVAREVEAVPGFFSSQPEPGPKWVPPGPVPPIPELSPEAPLLLDFSQIKIAHQPPPPSYPSDAKARRMMTNLVMEIVVDSQGKPVSCRPEPGPWLGFFAPTGAAYGMKWSFQPALLNGVPMPARFRLNMPFRLRN